MAQLNFPDNPLDGQLYPDPCPTGVTQYRWDSSTGMWRIVGVATGVTPGLYGNDLTVGQFLVDVSGNIQFAANVPIRAASTTSPGVAQLNNTTTSVSVSQALTAAAGKNLQDQIGNLALCTVPDHTNVVAALNDLQSQATQLQTDAMIWCGYYNASSGDISYVSIIGQRLGYQIGQELPVAGPKNGGDFFIVTVAGNPYLAGDYNAPNANIEVGNWILSETDRWSEVNAHSEVTAADVSCVTFAPLTATNVQNALFQISSLLRSGGVGGATISPVKPENPWPGMLWWDSDDGLFYIYYSDVNGSQWVETGGGGSQTLQSGGGSVYQVDTGVGLSGGPITTSGTISLEPAFVDPATPLNSTIGGVIPGEGFNYSNTTGLMALRITSDPTGVDPTTAFSQAGANVLNSRIDALSGNNVLAGTYNAQLGQLVYATPAGAAKGFVVGQNLPAPSGAIDNYYVIVTIGGDVGPNGPEVSGAGDWYLCQADAVPAVWFLIDYENIAVSSDNVSVKPIPGIEFATNVQSALEAIELQAQDRLEFVESTTEGLQISVSTPATTSNDGTTLSLGLNYASLTQRGIVQLTNDYKGNSPDLALTQLAGNQLNAKVDALAGANVLAGTYNANTGQVATVTAAGAAANFQVGLNAPSASVVPDNYYLIVTVGGNLGPPGAALPPTGVQSGDWFIVENETGSGQWVTIDYENRTVSAVNVDVSTIPNLSATNVQSALEQIEAQVDSTIKSIASSNDGISVSTVPALAAFGQTTTLTLNPATATDIGGVFVAPNNGLTLSPAGGLASAVASATTLGGVKIGDGIDVAPDGTISVDSSGGGTVTSVAFSGGTTGFTVTGSPITDSGVITLGGTLAVTNGGTGATTADQALTNLLPAQTGATGRVLQSDGTSASWAPLVRKLDNLVFDGSTTVYQLTINSVAVVPSSQVNLLIFVGGVLQPPTTAFTVSGSTITFTEAPPASMSFYGILLG